MAVVGLIFSGVKERVIVLFIKTCLKPVGPRI